MVPTRIISSVWIAFFFLLSTPISAQNPTPYEHITDPYMLKKAKWIWKTIEDAHHPDPWEVVNDLNRDVGICMEEDLQKKKDKTNKNENDILEWGEQPMMEEKEPSVEKGPDVGSEYENKHVDGDCEARNPVDKCWRCDPNWEKNRRRLADCAPGFAKGTTGGKAGRDYVVTDPSDDDLVNPKPGTLRHALIQEEPLWITFETEKMEIKLQEELIMMSSNKTIDGRGSYVRITGKGGFVIQYVRNVIIHGIYIAGIIPGVGDRLIRDSTKHVGYRNTSDGDCIGLYTAHHVWIDHVSLARCSDGMIDAIEGSTAVAITNNRMSHHNDVLLFGAKNSLCYDKVMQITVAFNYFGKNLTQRMPRGRWGFFHVANNDYSGWTIYAVGGSQNPVLLSHGNRFMANDNVTLKEVTKREYTEKPSWKTWTWRSEQDLFLNGAYFRQSGPTPTKQTVQPQPGKHVGHLTHDAGPLDCIPDLPC